MTTAEPSHTWQTPEIRDLCDAVACLRSAAMAHRWQVARLLEQGLPYLEISKRTHASTTTVTRVAYWLHHGEGGYRLVLDRLKRRRTTNA
jgi:TrpR-related protein YerC/YecD